MRLKIENRATKELLSLEACRTWELSDRFIFATSRNDNNIIFLFFDTLQIEVVFWMAATAVHLLILYKRLTR